MNLRTIDLNLLTIFEAVYEERSQAQARARLGMSQPAISSAIARLKTIIKAPLFEGRTRNLRTTRRADELYAQIHPLLNQMRAALGDIQAFDPATTHRHFHLATTYTGGAIYASSLYRRLNREAPHARLSIRTVDPTHELPRLLRERTLDAAVDHTMNTDSALDFALLSHHDVVVVCRPDHPRIGAEPTLAHLEREEFAGVIDDVTGLPVREIQPLRELLADRVKLHVPTALVLFHIVAHSDLLAATTRQVAEALGKPFDLRILTPPLDIPSIPVYLKWHRSLSNDPGHRWFRSLVREVWTS